MSTDQKKYGFFSQAALSLGGPHIYATPDGREVEVTAVSDDPAYPDYRWPDKRAVGEVTRWLRTATPSATRGGMVR